MIGPGRTLAAAISLAAAGGCFDPRYEDCQRACTSDEDCAPDQACGAVGMCAMNGEPLACGEPEVSPVGMYTLALMNQENGCSFDNWNGGSVTNVGMRISEMESLLAAEMMGNVATIFNAWLGASTFRGPRSGPRLELMLMGNKSTSQQNCVFTFDLTIHATLAGDLLDGSMFYRARTNGGTGCGLLNGCVSRQALHGTRTSQ